MTYEKSGVFINIIRSNYINNWLDIFKDSEKDKTKISVIDKE